MKTRPAEAEAEAQARKPRHSPPSKTKSARPAARTAVKRRAKPQAKKKPVPRTEQAKGWRPCDALLNGHHEKFCQKMALGMFSNYSCYLQAYPDSTVEAARVNASKLLTNANIRDRIAWIREDALKRVKITLEEQLLWYQTVAVTPTGYVDAESPLCQEVNYDAETGAVTKIKMPSKMDAKKQIDKLMGFEKADKAQERTADALGDLVTWIRGGANQVKGGA